MKKPICQVCKKEIERGRWSSGKLWDHNAWMTRKAHKECKSENMSRYMEGNKNKLGKTGPQVKRVKSNPVVDAWLGCVA